MMIPLISTTYLIFQFGRFAGFIILAWLMMRDLVRGQNHFTPGIFVFSIGNVVNSGYSVFDTILITQASPYGFIEFEIGLEQYALLRLLLLTIGAGLMVVGGAFIIWATLRGGNANS